MSIHVIGDRKVLEAFDLIGIPGHAPDGDIAALIAGLVEKHGAQLVLVQSEWMAQLSEDRLDHFVRALTCLVLEVPGVNRQAPDASVFTRSIRASVGAAT